MYIMYLMVIQVSFALTVGDVKVFVISGCQEISAGSDDTVGSYWC